MKKKNKKKVYLVSQGDYSDYCIIGVFDTKQKAKKFIDSFALSEWSEKRIETFTLNPFEEEIKNKLKPYFLRMDKEGKIIDLALSEFHYGYFASSKKTSWTHDKHWMNCNCFAKDEKHAIKIANEFRVQYLAFEGWGKRIKF